MIRLFRKSPLRVGFFLLFPAILLAGVQGHAGIGPKLPCEGKSYPPYPEVDKPPVVQAWDGAGSDRDWVPPACAGWTSSGFTEMVAVAGRFRSSSDAADLRRKIGGISGWKGIRYWSITQKQWRILVIDACAMPGPDAGDACREDFAPGEMEEGRTFYFRQEDNVFGEAVYRMRIICASADRLVFDIENIAPVRRVSLTLFPPGGVQSLHFLEREPQGVWRYYGIMRTGKDANPLTAGHGPSYVNRAVAFYRYLAGIPTDRDPPAAP